MDTLISAHGFAIPLAMLCAAVILLSPFLEVPPRRTVAQCRSCAVVAIMPGSPLLMVGLVYLVVRFLFDWVACRAARMLWIPWYVDLRQVR